MKIAADAFVFLIPLLVITGLLWIMGFLLLGSVCLGIALLVGLFFRDPHRNIPGEKDLVLAPADGKVLDLVKQSDGTTRVSIFLSLWTSTSIAHPSGALSGKSAIDRASSEWPSTSGPRWKTSETC